jgi:hypothetical protein
VPLDFPLVQGNEAALTQFFSNLLDNAVKFVKPGQIPQINIKGEKDGGWIRVWVEDNGIGIPKTFQKQLFGMFQRGGQGRAAGDLNRTESEGKNAFKLGTDGVSISREGHKEYYSRFPIFFSLPSAGHLLFPSPGFGRKRRFNCRRGSDYGRDF